MILPKKWVLCLMIASIFSAFTMGSAVALAGSSAKTEISKEAAELAYANDGDDRRETTENGETAESESEEIEAKATYIGNYQVGKSYRMKTTGYCSCKKCTGSSGASKTASGTWPKAKHTISMSGVPFGTRVKMGGITYVVEDRGGGVKGKHIDVYYNTHSQALKHGLKYMDAVILGKATQASSIQSSSASVSTEPPESTTTPASSESPKPTAAPESSETPETTDALEPAPTKESVDINFSAEETVKKSLYIGKVLY